MFYLEQFLAKVLKCGPIPEHMAVIMDGNRRYGKIHSIDNTRNVYIMGIKALELFYKMCFNIGIKQLTVYAFSIENFKRPPEEVSVLLEDILPKVFTRIIKEHEHGLPDEYNIQFNIIGNKHLLSKHLQELIQRVERQTKDKTQLIVNIALAYTSRDEIAQAIRSVLQKVSSNSIEPTAIDAAYLQRHLYLPGQVDCLLRTSGEVRFSDFLLWQIDTAQVNIYDTLWPEFGLWAFVKLIVDYQRKVLLLLAQQKKHARYLNAILTHEQMSKN